MSNYTSIFLSSRHCCFYFFFPKKKKTKLQQKVSYQPAVFDLVLLACEYKEGICVVSASARWYARTAYSVSRKPGVACLAQSAGPRAAVARSRGLVAGSMPRHPQSRCSGAEHRARLDGLVAYRPGVCLLCAVFPTARWIWPAG